MTVDGGCGQDGRENPGREHGFVPNFVLTFGFLGLGLSVYPVKSKMVRDTGFEPVTPTVSR